MNEGLKGLTEAVCALRPSIDRASGGSLAVLLAVMLIGVLGCWDGTDAGSDAARGDDSRLMGCLEGSGASVASSSDELFFFDEREAASSGAIYDVDSGALVQQWSERGAPGPAGRWIVWSFDSFSGDARSVEQIVDASGVGESAVLYMTGARRMEIAATTRCLERATERNQQLYDRSH